MVSPLGGVSAGSEVARSEPETLAQQLRGAYRVLKATTEGDVANIGFAIALASEQVAGALQANLAYILAAVRRTGPIAAMGTGWSLSLGRPEAGPAGRCDEAGGNPNASEPCSTLSRRPRGI